MTLRPAGKALFVYFYRRIGTDLSTQTAPSTLPVTYKLCRMISLGIYLGIDDNTLFGAGLNTKAAAFAAFLEDDYICLFFLFFFRFR